MYHQGLSPSPYINQKLSEQRMQHIKEEMERANSCYCPMPKPTSVGLPKNLWQTLRPKLALGLTTFVFVISTLGAVTPLPQLQSAEQSAPVSHGGGCGVSQSVSTVKICH